MKNLPFFAVACALVLSACAGRKPNPVQEIQPGDASLTCKQLSNEVRVNNAAILGLIEEKKKKQGANTAAGVAGAVVFFPALFFLDLKGAAGEEARAYQRRNEGLIKRYTAKGCKPPIKTLSDEEALKQINAKKKTTQ